MVTHFHHRKHASDIRCGNAQDRDLLKLAQPFHLLLHIFFWNARQKIPQLGLIRLQWNWVIQMLWINQLIKQDRITRELLGNHWASGTQAHQLHQSSGMLIEQFKVSGACGDTVQQCQYARQTKFCIGMSKHGLIHFRH
ncbi:Uncharacterised protein [Vibrio cholerae]|uniref:Uncharacterized protein n=1 Tax=Vibrio cholerae TaxID=666 RepID=A0A655W104_VIBCL|nr:Uncharacterised protein [Vibrio cholerae]CSB80678.1 Uncharacterised protein [Vibrio cholerae]